MAYFVDLFGHRVQNYVERVLDGARPKRVVVCMIYYLDVHGRGSWADCFLAAMGYNCAPWRLQAAIRKVFELATSRIRIPGVDVLAFPLFEVLDGNDPRDYVQRVEPSPRGGAKMARALLDAIFVERARGEQAAMPGQPAWCTYADEGAMASDYGTASNAIMMRELLKKVSPPNQILRIGEA